MKTANEVFMPGYLVAYQFQCESGNVISYGIVIQMANGKRQILLPTLRDSWMRCSENELQYHILEVRVPSSYLTIAEIIRDIDSAWEVSTVTWTKTSIMELTMQEIADKFGIKVEQLKIKK